jgi:Carboxypeptidase regulatory-like domain
MKRALLVTFLLGSVAVSVASPALAQSGSPSSELRGVTGTVCDKNENPIASAVVYLKNVRTLTVRTYISGEKGEYHFSGLDPNADYELHAEHDDLTSANHTVSSLDSRKEMNVTLKIDKEKKKTEK